MVFGGNKSKVVVPEETKVEHPVYNAKETEEPVEYTSQAFSMGKHPEGGFALITVAFNPVTRHAKVTDVKKVGDNRSDAEYAFRIRIGEFFADQEMER